MRRRIGVIGNAKRNVLSVESIENAFCIPAFVPKLEGVPIAHGQHFRESRQTRLVLCKIRKELEQDHCDFSVEGK
jgi:hypothetical protein